MNIGIPRELKTFEGRVGLVPTACAELVSQGHEVFIEHDAGYASGYDNEEYKRAGVVVCESAAALYAIAELIIKVKEPQPGDLKHLDKHHRLFCYLHLAANRELAKALCKTGLTAIAFESISDANGHLPLLTPMSEIAGRLAVQIGTYLLHQPTGGRGVLLGGVVGSERGHVVVLGAGAAGGQAVQLASVMGARVSVFDINRERLALLQTSAGVTGLYATSESIHEALTSADLVVGAVLVPNRRAPQLVSEPMVKDMPRGSVIVDIAIDQGGCIENIRETDYAHPTYSEFDVQHFAVANMPGAVPRTASQALSAAIMAYVSRLAKENWLENQDLRRAVNIGAGEVASPVLREELHI